jgi:polyhydroxyalkanoate synthesis regulator phasin
MKILLLVVFHLFVTASLSFAITEEKLQERIDKLLSDGDMHSAIALKSSWIATQLADELSKLANHSDISEQRKIDQLKNQLDLLFSRINTQYPNPPKTFGAYLGYDDAFRFGYAKGFFDTICGDTVIYDGAGKRYEASIAGMSQGRDTAKRILKKAEQGAAANP